MDSGTSCDFNRSCVYTGTIAWAGPDAPLPMEVSPGAAFERLFGDSAKTDARRAPRPHAGEGQHPRFARWARSRGLQNGKSAPPIAHVSRAISRACATSNDAIQRALEYTGEVPVIDRPAGVPDTFEQHAKLMFDLQLLAYQADVTRVVTFMLGREFSGRTYPEIGVPGCTSSDLAPPARPGAHGEVREDQPLSRVALRVFPREA